MDKLNFNPSLPSFLDLVIEELQNSTDSEVRIAIWVICIVSMVVLFFAMFPHKAKGYDETHDKIRRTMRMKKIDPIRYYGLEDILKDINELKEKYAERKGVPISCLQGNIWKHGLENRLAEELRRAQEVELRRKEPAERSDDDCAIVDDLSCDDATEETKLIDI